MAEASEALELVRAVESSFPWRFYEVTQPEKWAGSEVKFGAIRNKAGVNVFQPFEGSASIMMGIDKNIDFIVKAPELLMAMAAQLEASEKEKTKLEAKIEVLEGLLKDKS